MKHYEIDLEIDADGNVASTVKGVKGKACGELSAFLDALGTVTHDSPTPEFYQTETQSVRTTTKR